MNKIVITKKEIEQLEKTFFIISYLSKYKEEDYKEVFVHKGNVYTYDVYTKHWVHLIDVVDQLKEGFYNYNIIEEITYLSKYLDKNKIYEQTPEAIHLYAYNKELMAWESFCIDKDSKLSRSILFGIYTYLDYRIITREEFNKIVLVNELVS